MPQQFRFGSRSMQQLNTCDERLQRVLHLAIKRTPYDFTVLEGHRSVADQQEAFRKGFSRIDGVTRKGKHNYSPSLAVDIAPWIKGTVPWNNHRIFACIAGVVLCCAAELEIPLRWGGDWDGDGDLRDQTLHDLPHFELV